MHSSEWYLHVIDGSGMTILSYGSGTTILSLLVILV